MPALQQFLGQNAGQNIEFLKLSSNLLKVIICSAGPKSKSALEQAACEFMQQVLEPQNVNDHEIAELFDGIVAPLTSAIIVMIDQPTTLPRLFDLLLSRIPSFFELTLSK